MRRRAGLLAALLALCLAAPSYGALSGSGAIMRASNLPAVKRELELHRHAFARLTGSARDGWQIGYYAAGREILLVVFDPDGSLRGAYAGYKVAWQMARGYPGAFGGDVDSLYVWLTLSALFVAPFFDWRRPAALHNLDLLALCAFSVSFALFNHGDIALSVPLVYPPLLYLLGRLLWVAVGRTRPTPLSLNVPVSYLGVACVVLVAVRIALALSGASVIDVGYADALGAQRILHGQALYGTFASPVADGDTYGPVSYEAYVPFVGLFGAGQFEGDSVPAANAAAIAFDLACIALLYLLGRRIRGPALGVVLAYAWIAYPFTALALACASNDALVAALVLAALLGASSSARRGALAALAGLSKFAPLALVPLLLTHRLREQGLRGVLHFAAAFALVGAAVAAPAVAFDTLATIYHRTLAYQAARTTPFSIWGLYGHLHTLQTLVSLAAIALAAALAIVPRRDGLAALAAGAAAILIALQLSASYWFYLYIPWFFGAALVALLGGDEQLLDRVGAQRLRAADQHRHQPRVLVGRL